MDNLRIDVFWTAPGSNVQVGRKASSVWDAIKEYVVTLRKKAKSVAFGKIRIIMNG